ncbi:MAG: leucyl aminopeptidase [Bacteroidetes bacterium]|nr:MAG: leucyl aminopeptidase [Bacteroidota bacterium]
MQTTIQSTKGNKSSDSLILLLADIKKLPTKIFSKEESDFIKKEVKADRKSVIINQYNRTIFLFLPDFSKKESALLEKCRNAGESFLAQINKLKLKRIVLVDLADRTDLTLAMAEGMALGNYQFLKYRKNKKSLENSLKEIAIKSSGLRNDKISDLQNLIDAVVRARDLVNEPQSFLSATQLSSEFVKMGKEAKFKVEVFRKQKIKSMKMGGILAVNKGSVEPPTFTVMTYKPANAKNKKPYILVGKGVVYDTGGLSLKPTANSMDFMKSDMAGSAVVASTLFAIAKMKLPVYVMALVPATDNRPGGDAYTPGDVITMMSGHTVEVLNTDAEGRLILADALHYAKKFKPELVMDFATLTGAAAAAIGSYGIVCMGTADEKTKTKLKEAGEKRYERLAEFPIWDEYDDLIKSDIADMKNIGGPYAGAITAGKFLQRYIDYPWMHFDIAGPSFVNSPSSYRGKNGTGYGVRLMVEFFSNL